LVRSEFEKGGGVPCLIALSEGATMKSRRLGLGLREGLLAAREPV